MGLAKVGIRGITDLFRDTETDIIYFRKYKKEWGGEIKLSTHTTEIKEAKKFAADVYAKFRNKKAKTGQRQTALELFDLWRERKEIMGKSPGTLTSIRASRNYLAPFFERMMPEEITGLWWESEYIPKVRQTANNPGRKFFNDRKWMISFLKDILTDQQIDHVPQFINPDKKSNVGKVLSDEDVSTLISMAQNDDLRLAILMAATMGMRRLEIFALACARVDLEKKTIKLRAEDTKTRKARTFAISAACYPGLASRCYDGAEWIFPSKTDVHKPLHKDGYVTAWTNLKKMTGIKCRFHDLRHTFLTKAFKAPGANAALICTYAGLSLEVAERVYLHLNEDDTRGVAGLVKYE